MYAELHQSTNQQYYFIIKGANGEPVATSEMYTQKASAQATLQRIFAETHPDSLILDETLDATDD